MKTIDKTNGLKPVQTDSYYEEYQLTVDYRTGSRYAYNGRTKKECEDQFKDEFGSYRGFVRKWWSIERYEL